MEVALDEQPAGPAASEGFERFFRRQYPVVVRIAFGVVRDTHLAEDVAQDVMIAAERRFSEFTGRGHAEAWVRRAAVHEALNALRGRRRRDERHRRSGALSTVVGPEELLIDHEEEAGVRDALSRLPLHAVTVLVLRHSGLSYAEVSQAMGVKVGHVGTMLRRAEAALRKEVTRATRG